MNDTNDLFRKIFLAVCKHLAISIATVVIYYLFAGLLRDYTCSLLTCLFITNCTVIITGKMNRILERLPQDEEKE